MALYLDSVIAKLARAEEHIASVEAELRIVFNPKPYGISKEADPNHAEWRMRAHLRAPLDLTRVSLAFGDAVNCMRCALDHLAHEVARREAGRLGIPTPDATNFPILDDPKKIASKTEKLYGRQMVAAFDLVQPYRRADANIGSVLRILQNLNNDDKHRLIQPVVSAAMNARIRYLGLPPGVIPTERMNEGALHDGAVVLTITTPVPAPELEYEADVFIQTAVAHRRGWTPTVVLARCMLKEVRDVVGIIEAAGK